MTQRLEALAVGTYQKDGQEKTSYTRIGVAFPMRDKEGYQVVLDAMPASQDGKYKILLMPPRERSGY